MKISGQLGFSLLRLFGSALVLSLLSWADLTSLGVRDLVKHDSLECCMHGLPWGRQCAVSVFFIKLWLMLGAAKLFPKSCGVRPPFASCLHLHAGCPRTTVSLERWGAAFLINAQNLAQQIYSTFSCVGEQLVQVCASFSLCCRRSYSMSVKW